MATRFKLESTGTPAVSPSLQQIWTHLPATLPRMPMKVTPDASAFTTLSYAPDGADHLVAGSAFTAQFISEPLDGAQTIGVQTVTLTVMGLEANLGNNLTWRWTLYVVSNDGSTLRGTLVAARSDATELSNSQTNRTDSATSTSVSALSGDRIVLELGVSGTPTGAGNVQGHNASIRLGTAGTDLPADDSTTADGNSWVELGTSTLTLTGDGGGAPSSTFVSWIADDF
jgi:hypothetical protein